MITKTKPGYGFLNNHRQSPIIIPTVFGKQNNKLCGGIVAKLLLYAFKAFSALYVIEPHDGNQEWE